MSITVPSECLAERTNPVAINSPWKQLQERNQSEDRQAQSRADKGKANCHRRGDHTHQDSALRQGDQLGMNIFLD